MADRPLLDEARGTASAAQAVGASDVATLAQAGDTIATATWRRRGELRMAHGRGQTATGPTASGTATSAAHREPAGGGDPGPEGPGTGGEAPGLPSDLTSVVVRAGESPWTAEELATVRAELESELARIRRDLENLQSSIAEVLRDGGDGAGDDTADTGSKAYEREQEMTLLGNTRESLFQTEHALARIADGTYGGCESCGEGIGKLRLQAFPRATLCVSCKQRQERR